MTRPATLEQRLKALSDSHAATRSQSYHDIANALQESSDAARALELAEQIHTAAHDFVLQTAAEGGDVETAKAKRGAAADALSAARERVEFAQLRRDHVEAERAAYLAAGAQETADTFRNEILESVAPRLDRALDDFASLLERTFVLSERCDTAKQQVARRLREAVLNRVRSRLAPIVRSDLPGVTGLNYEPPNVTDGIRAAIGLVVANSN